MRTLKIRRAFVISLGAAALATQFAVFTASADRANLDQWFEQQLEMTDGHVALPATRATQERAGAMGRAGLETPAAQTTDWFIEQLKMTEGYFSALAADFAEATGTKGPVAPGRKTPWQRTPG